MERKEIIRQIAALLICCLLFVVSCVPMPTVYKPVGSSGLYVDLYGNYTSSVAGSGNVTTSGGTVGSVPIFTTPTNIETGYTTVGNLTGGGLAPTIPEWAPGNTLTQSPIAHLGANITFGSHYLNDLGQPYAPNDATTKTYVDDKFSKYDDLQIAMANAKTPAANAPTWRSYVQTEVPAFSPTQVNVLYFTAQLPHSYKEGSNIEFHIHLVYPDNLTGYSIWYFSYSWANIDGTFAAASSVTANITSPAVTNKHQMAGITTSINGAGKTISSVLLCSIQRLGNASEDSYASEIYLISADFHYLKDSTGSTTETTK